MSDVPFFQSLKSDSHSRGRLGKLSFQNPHRVLTVETPVFMPVGTQASVKGLWQEDLEEMGYELILANTYHLYLRPGMAMEVIPGGVKEFMGWEKHALLTDSGGYQVFSLSDNVTFREDGVEFRSHLDGSRHLFTPQSVVDFQNLLGSDIMMVLDDCPPAGADAARVNQSMERTHRWAHAAYTHFHDLVARGKVDRRYRKLFGIIQGGLDTSLRKESAASIQSLGFDGIAVGGLSVGESRREMYDILSSLGEHLDEQRVHYLMGVGTVPDFLEAVKNGIDMFDCVLPTRNARNGQALTSQGKLNIRNAAHSMSTLPLDQDCHCRTCRRYSRGYIRHLFRAGEMLGPMLMTYHNLHFMNRFMKELRASISGGRFSQFYNHWKSVPF